MFEDPAERRSSNLVGAFAVALSDRLQVNSDSAALVSLDERGPLTVEFLRRVIGLSHSATVRLVDRLSDDGLLTRAAGPDARTVSVRLTARGRRRAAALRKNREQLLREALAPLSKAERLEFGRLVGSVLAEITTGRWQARFTCRFCDHRVCQAIRGCPVDQAAAEFVG
jgi:MarR family transcriptional repressor of emrRAB